MAPSGEAPALPVPAREIIAIEHPMVIKNIDNGLKTFGKHPLHKIFDTDDFESSLPMYIRHNDPACRPIMSTNMPCNNVLIKVTVPKRTGRKRKRGSQGPWLEAEDPMSLDGAAKGAVGSDSLTDTLSSHSRLDKSNYILKSLQDNPDRYTVEPVGSIDQTHRYRGLTDFHYATSHGPFMSQFKEKVVPMDIDKMKEFRFNPSRGIKLNDEIIPPPALTDHYIPVNWGYHQNQHVKMHKTASGETQLVNQSRPAGTHVKYIQANAPIPLRYAGPPPSDPILESLVKELQKAMDERPIWTRRALVNRVRGMRGTYLMRSALEHVAYQFRGGPWRDAMIKFGIDPRTDPKYRFYQTIFFKLHRGSKSQKIDPKLNEPQEKHKGAKLWVDHTAEDKRNHVSKNSHIFDGTAVHLDGKVWQVCDITDPLLKSMLETTNLREDCDMKYHGWYLNGTWAKVHAIMRMKLTALRVGAKLEEQDFENALNTPDLIEGKDKVTIVTPDLALRGRNRKPVHKRRSNQGKNSRPGKLRGVYAPRKKKAPQEVVAGLVQGADPRVEEAMRDLQSRGEFDNGAEEGEEEEEEEDEGEKANEEEENDYDDDDQLMSPEDDHFEEAGEGDEDSEEEEEEEAGEEEEDESERYDSDTAMMGA